jgi:hypothetical protein
MCDEAHYNYDVCEHRQHRARKEHQCCACRETIRKGDVYQSSFAVGYTHEPERYKHCLRCAKMLSEILKAVPYNASIAWDLNCGEDWKDTIGELPEEVAALAFMTADDAQQKLVPILGLESK